MYLRKKFKEGRVDHVELLHVSKEWNPSDRVVAMGVQEGWLVLGGNKLVMKTPDDKPDLEFQILFVPGRYCCFCDAPVGSEQEAREHINVLHKDAENPDKENPAGWWHVRSYICRLIGEAPVFDPKAKDVAVRRWFDRLLGRKNG